MWLVAYIEWLGCGGKVAFLFEEAAIVHVKNVIEYILSLSKI